MKKFSLAFAITIMSGTIAFAQLPPQAKFSFDALGKFDNINSVIDPVTKKERPITDSELKNAIGIEIQKRLKTAGSVKVVDVKKISVLPNIVTVPLLEPDGIPFYTIIIDRETGFTNNEYVSKKFHEPQMNHNEEWEKSYLKRQTSMEDLEKDIAAYRNKYPKTDDSKKGIFAPAPQPRKDMYQPKAPARKIMIK